MVATRPRKKAKAAQKPVKKPAKKARTKKDALKTTQTTQSVDAFLRGVPKVRQEQARTAIKMLRRITGQPPRMWGPSIIGFGRYRYTTKSGRQGEMCAAAFSPRKASFVFYVDADAIDEALWLRLGTYKRGLSCVYVQKFEDIDLGVLEHILKASYARVKATHRG